MSGTKLCCLVTGADTCVQLAQGCYLEVDRSRFEPAIFSIASERSTFKPHRQLLGLYYICSLRNLISTYCLPLTALVLPL